MPRYKIQLLLVPLVASSLACAQMMALSQPGPLDCKDSALASGAERTAVVACLGMPQSTTKDGGGGKMSEVFLFEDGRKRNSTGSRVGRVFLYTVGDILTLFLTQLITMPTEKLALEAATFMAVVDFELDESSIWRVARFTEREAD